MLKIEIYKFIELNPPPLGEMEGALD